VNTGVAIERLLPWGGRVGLSATADRTLTNSSFAYYNPSGNPASASTSDSPCCGASGGR